MSAVIGRDSGQSVTKRGNKETNQSFTLAVTPIVNLKLPVSLLTCIHTGTVTTWYHRHDTVSVIFSTASAISWPKTKELIGRSWHLKFHICRCQKYNICFADFIWSLYSYVFCETLEIGEKNNFVQFSFFYVVLNDNNSRFKVLNIVS